MGLFALPMGETWQENLENLIANVELMKQHPGGTSYLFHFMRSCLDAAENQYLKEQEGK